MAGHLVYPDEFPFGLGTLATADGTDGMPVFQRDHPVFHQLVDVDVFCEAYVRAPGNLKGKFASVWKENPLTDRRYVRRSPFLPCSPASVIPSSEEPY